MSPEIAISTSALGKAYHIYSRPIDRLKQMLWRRRQALYREYWALRDVSFEVRIGETVGVIGSNGSGKSTLLQCLCGTLQPSCGQFSVNGKIAALLELGAGFNPEFTGRENVFLAATILGLSGAQVEERFPAILAFAGIGDFIDQPVKVYSSGMYARLAFAVAAHVDADILIIDEILSVGDAAFSQKCSAFFSEFKKSGTLLVVSHDAGTIIKLCDRAIWLDRGRLRSDGSPAQVCGEYAAFTKGNPETASSFHIGSNRDAPNVAVRVTQDARQELFSKSPFQNVIRVSEFLEDGRWYGLRGATITGVQLLDESGRAVTKIVGGEVTTIEIRCRAESVLDQPIIGFYVKDAQGQSIFGNNTYLACLEQPAPGNAGDILVGRFRFQFPFLPPGDYSVVPAIANGSQANHQQHHWIEDALLFSVESSHFTKSLVGLPMLSITLEKKAEPAAA